MLSQVKQCEELMVSERDGVVIVINGLFVDADFQIGEGEAGWDVRICDMFHCRLTFHCCKDFTHNVFF